MTVAISSSVSFRSRMVSLNSIGFIFSVILAAFAPISTTIAEIALYGAFLFFLLDGQWQKKVTLLSHPIVLSGLAIFFWVTIGVFYSEANFHDALNLALKYDKLLLIWCLIYYLSGNRERQKIIFIAALMGVLANLLAIYLNFFILPSNLSIKFSVPSWPAAQSNGLVAFIFIVLSFSSFAWAKSASKRYQRYLISALAILAIVGEVYLNASRTGYVIEFSILLFFTIYFYRLKGIAYAFIAGAIIFGGAYLASPIFHDRVNQAVVNTTHYLKGEGGGESSAGLRLTYYRTTINLLKTHPSKLLFGFGTGSLPILSQRYFQVHPLKAGYAIQQFNNPHDQYLFLLLENGMVGLGLFSIFLYFIFAKNNLRDRPWSFVILMSGIAFSAGCIFNSWLHDFAPGLTFILFIAILYARYAKVEDHE